MADQPPPSAAALLARVGGLWGSVAALATVLIYAIGYLSQRFHYTALGAAPELTIFDERYLFSGARFLVFIVVETVPLVALAALVSAAVIAVRRSGGGEGRERTSGPQPPTRKALALEALFLSVLVVLTMVFSLKVVEVTGLLFRSAAPGEPVAHRLTCMALDPGDPYRLVHFKLLILLLAAALALAWRAETRQHPFALRGGVWFLVVVQLMLLPIHHGTLYADKRLSELAGLPDLAAAGKVWLVDRGSSLATVLVTVGSGAENRRLYTVATSDLNDVAVVRLAPLGAAIALSGCQGGKGGG